MPLRRHSVRRLLRRLHRSERGNVAIVFAVGMPLVAAGAAFSVETSYHYYRQVRLQSAADAAAYSGGLERLRGASTDTIRGAATAAATENGWQATGGGITVNTPPASGPNAGADAVEVLLTQSEPRFFSAVLTDRPLQFRTRAVGVYRVASNACVLALSRTASPAVDIRGSARMNLTGCDVVANSGADDALNVWGAARLAASCAISAGGVANKDGITLSDCPAPITQAPPVLDPFRDVPEPAQPSGGCKNDNGAVLQPGRYCAGMDLKDEVELQPGLYFLSGDFKANANAVIRGTGVTIFLEGNARVRMNGGAHLTLSAPTSGTYAGILFFGDRDNSQNAENVFNGDATSNLTGDLYFPSQAVAYQGSYSGAGGCTHIIANTVSWSGNASLQMDCSARGMAAIPGRQVVRLAE
ncbi:pilus assembly protein TadG-related protein [Phenylobacterium sp.]|jgi:Flp pilus assembly protein TadG|uniref:pilus assembly protein TadG-related protein n=1 Tax=Phenylobacterium sp. TaxID=1871053 RepID=UPI002F950C9C